MDIVNLLNIVDGVARLATVGLILMAVGSIVVFYRVFQADLNRQD